MDLGPKAEMREIRTSGLMSGIWKRNGLIVTAPDLDSTPKAEARIRRSALRARFNADYISDMKPRTECRLQTGYPSDAPSALKSREEAIKINSQTPEKLSG
jgi:hypothetical protein